MTEPNSLPDPDEATHTQASTPIGNPKPASEPLPEIKIEGYRLQHEISRGGQAVVYNATFLKTGRRVAIKIMREGPLATENGRARFTREAQILASLNHPYIVTILDRGRTADGSEFFAMDYIDGKSLDDGTWKLPSYMNAVNENPAMPLQLFLKVCDAVNAAHLRGIVHRDLKPSNIRLDERGDPHVLDFGLARGGIGGDSESTHEPVTITGQFLGSLPWASPEQAEGIGQKIDMRSDVYSLGVILYQLVTGGHFPYQVVGSMRDILNNIMTAEPPAPSTIMTERETRDLARRARRAGPPAKLLNAALDGIILRALAKRRDERYQSAGELARDIEAYLAGRPLSTGAQPTAGTNRTLILAGAGVAAAAIIGIAVYVTMILTRGTSAPPASPPHVQGTTPGTAPTTPIAAVPPAPAPPQITIPPPPAIAPLHPLVAASPFKSDYQQVDALMNRWMPAAPFFTANGPSRFAEWRAGAERGDPVGQYLLSRCYEQGAGVARSPAEAERILRLSADQGLPMALCVIGVRFRANPPPEQNFAEAIQWHNRATEAGSTRAMVELGIMHMNGLGTPVDHAAATVWLRKAADLGSPAAFYFLGEMQRLGQGVPINPAQAAVCFRRAADGGVPNAMVGLGALYMNGRGVPQDFSLAMALFVKAEAENFHLATFYVGELYANGQGVPRDIQTAIDLYTRAANDNVIIAMRKLGSLYDQGTSIPRDHAQAVAWYTKAANAGDAEARQWLATNGRGN